MRSVRLLLLGLSLFLPLLPAQSSLTTTWAGGNGQSGNMFDLDATSSVQVLSLDCNLIAGTWTVQVYAVTGGGSYLGKETDPTAWTLVDTFSGVTSTAGNVATALPPLSQPVAVTPGSKQGVYVTLSAGGTMNYSNGTTEGAVFATDGVLTFYEGKGVIHPFGVHYAPRVWNGTIHYAPLGVQPDYQVNQPGASLDVNGAQSLGYASASTASPTCTLNTLNWAPGPSSVAYDIVVTTGGSLIPASAGALVTAGGQVINIEYFHASRVWLFGASFTMPPFPASLDFYLPHGAPPVQGQMAAMDPTSPDGMFYSQAIDHWVTPGSSTVSLPLLDDGGQTIDLGPACWVTGGTTEWYGTPFSHVTALSNGRLSAGTTIDTDFSPTLAEALGDEPFLGYWCDLSPNSGGTWSIGGPAPDSLTLSYNQIPYFGDTVPVSFAITYTGATREWHLENLQGILPSTALRDSYLGMSPGSLGATDPGSATFGVGSSGGATNPGDMLYEFTQQASRPASISALMSTLTFTPDGAGNYTFIGY